VQTNMRQSCDEISYTHIEQAQHRGILRKLSKDRVQQKGNDHTDTPVRRRELEMITSATSNLSSTKTPKKAVKRWPFPECQKMPKNVCT